MSRDILVHSCQARTEIRGIKNLDSTRRYYTDDPKFLFFKAIPLKCACKKRVTLIEAELFLVQGKACVIYKPKDGEPLDEKRIDDTQIIMPVSRSQTPRVDLITKADMERAYVYRYEKYIEHIEQIHDMILSERAKLIIPFHEDPQEGRLLFPFGPDQRTGGGHQ